MFSSQGHDVSNKLKILSSHLLLDKVGVAVEFATMLQASGPGKNAGNGVGAGRPSLKVLLRIMLAITLFYYHVSKASFIYKF